MPVLTCPNKCRINRSNRGSHDRLATHPCSNWKYCPRCGEKLVPWEGRKNADSDTRSASASR
jgi:hypothetical protein